MSNTVINTNVLALNSHRALKNVGTIQAKSSEKLSTGQRINRAADDAAGLAISEKMRSQVRGLDRASSNAQDGISLIQTAEGALQETENMLQRMRELVVQASNDSLEQSDRDKIALEVDELTSEIGETSSRTEFNKKKLIDGSWESKKLYFQVGANSEQGLAFNIDGMSDVSLGVTKSEIGDIIRGSSSASSSTKITDAKVGLAAATAITYEDADFNTAVDTDLGFNMATDGKITVGTAIKATDGTDFAANDVVELGDLAGKTFFEPAGAASYSFSADGKSVTKNAFGAAGPATLINGGAAGTTKFDGVNFTSEAGEDLKADVDLYLQDGTKVDKNTALAAETYFTGDGSKSFTIASTGLTATVAIHATTTNAPVTLTDAKTVGSAAKAAVAEVKTPTVITSATTKTAFDALKIGADNSNYIEVTKNDTGEGTIKLTGAVTTLDGTAVADGDALGDLAGKTIASADGKQSWTFSADGLEVTTFDHAAGGAAAKATGAAVNGITFTADAAGIKTGTDLYEADGTKVASGGNLLTGKTYFTADGSQSFVTGATQDADMTISANKSTVVGTTDAATQENIVTTPAAAAKTAQAAVAAGSTPNKDLGKFAGDYGSIKLDTNGMFTGTAKSTDDASVDTSSESARAGKTFVTDKGTISFGADGKTASIDKSLTTDNYIAGSQTFTSDSGTLGVKDGKVDAATTSAGTFELADGTQLNVTAAKDLNGKTIKSGNNYVTIDDAGNATKSTTPPGPQRNQQAKDAETKFQSDVAALKKADPNVSRGKIISLVADKVDAAIENVSAQRAQLGAYQNRMEHTIKNLNVSSENLSGAESRIRDTDMAKEMMTLTKSNVLQQAATSMLAQANQAPQSILSLLR